MSRLMGANALDDTNIAKILSKVVTPVQALYSDLVQVVRMQPVRDCALLAVYQGLGFSTAIVLDWLKCQNSCSKLFRRLPRRIQDQANIVCSNHPGDQPRHTLQSRDREVQT